MIAEQIDLPVARAMIAAMGPEEAESVLKRCSDTDVTDHEALERFAGVSGWRRDIVDRDGINVITAIMDLGSDCYWEDGSVTMPQRQFPATVTNAAAGRLLTDLVGDNPLFVGLFVETMTSDEAGTVIDVVDAGRTLDWIMASIGN